MDLVLGMRESDSPWIASVWTCSTEQVRWMTSVASETWGLIFWEQDGVPHVEVTGPETGTATAPVPAGATFVGVQMAVGTALRMVPTGRLLDGGISLPEVTRRGFVLDGWRWETPGVDDVEALVERLVRAGVVVRDPVVDDVLRGGRPALSSRSVERRFRAATGFSPGRVQQIARARAAAVALMRGEETADVAWRLGYYDEPHLARALRRFVGRTAGALRAGEGGAIALDPQDTTSYTSLTTPLV